MYEHLTVAEIAEHVERGKREIAKLEQRLAEEREHSRVLSQYLADRRALKDPDRDIAQGR